MAKDATPSFIVALRLDTSCGDGKELDKALDAGRMRFNACLGEALKRIDRMREAKAYRRAVAMPKSDALQGVQGPTHAVQVQRL